MRQNSPTIKLSILKYTIWCFLVYFQGYASSFWFCLVPEHFHYPIRNPVSLTVTPHPPALGNRSSNRLDVFAFSGHCAPREPYPVSGFFQFSRLCASVYKRGNGGPDTVTIQSHLATKSQAPRQCPFTGLSLGFVVWGAAGNGKFHTPSNGHHNSAVAVFCCLEQGRMWSQHCLILTLANNGKNNNS